MNIKACFAGTPQESTVEQDLNYFDSKGIIGKIENAKEVLFVMTSAAIDTERMNQIVDETRKAITFEKLIADSTYDVAKQFMPTDYLKWRMRIINVSPANAKQEAERIDKSENANASQPYSFSRKAKAAIKNAREEIAKCINAKPSEIFFTSGGTESDNWAIKGCAFADESKRATITSTIEHHAVLRSCQFIERLGYPVAYINPNSNGLITVEMLERVIAGTTNLVSVATANNEIGTIQPINKLAEIAHRNGAFFHTDAVQAMGHIPIDVNELNVDLLSASAHKFNGPKGIGFLYVREGTPILPLLNGGAQENSLRAGTENVASIVGMATALNMNCSQMQQAQSQSAKMAELICSILNDAEVDYIRNGYSNGLKGTLNLSFRDKDGEAILHRLDLRGILVSTGSACDSNSTQVSHVIRAINVPDSYAKGTIRISLGKDNTIEEAKAIGETLVSVLMEPK